MKSILANFRRSKTAVLTILKALNFDIKKMSHFEMLPVLKNSKFRAVKRVKNVIFLGLKSNQNLFHVVSEYQNIPKISTLDIPN